MAQGAGTERRNCSVPQYARWATQCRQHLIAAGEVCEGRPRKLRVVEVEAGVAARVEAWRDHGVAAGGRRLLGDRAVARP